MKKSRARARKMKKALVITELLHREIEQRAYELYELRGKEDGHDLEDWLQAETEVARRATQ